MLFKECMFLVYTLLFCILKRSLCDCENIKMLFNLASFAIFQNNILYVVLKYGKTSQVNILMFSRVSKLLLILPD